jgi:UPF0176 protein
MTCMNILNIAAYKFVEIPNPAELCPIMKTRADELNLRGTILLASEGINLFMAGDRASIDSFVDFLRSDERFESRFSDITTKESYTEHPPFRRMEVRVKKEIITMKQPMICPNTSDRAPGVDPQVLKRWLDQGHDDQGREVVMLDTRNDYEVEIGTFKNALDLSIEIFSEFPEAYLRTANDTKADLTEKTVVTFCTGGIRCEKAALFLREAKLKNVYQLNGGILRYFEEVGADHWQGECFVFDERRAVDVQLNPTKKQYTS